MSSVLTGCLYIPHFPAWAAARGQRSAAPVAVIQSGRVLACSRKLRTCGITAGMPGSRARALVPGARLVARDAALEQAVWEEVLHNLNAVTPFVESRGPGLAFFRTGDEQAAGALGERLRAQSAFAPARSYAHLAALRAAPGNTLMVSPCDLSSFLRSFDVDLLMEVGFAGEMTGLMKLFGYGTLGKAAGLSLRHLRGQFGAEGVRLHSLLHPAVEMPVGLFRPPATIRERYDFEDPVREPGELLPVVEELTRRAAASLGALFCRRVRLILEARGEGGLSRSRVLPEAVSSPRRLFQTAATLLCDLLQGQEVISMAIELGALQPGALRQSSLFRERPSAYEAARAVDRKYPGAMLHAVLCPHALLEEERARLEPFPLQAPARPRPARGRRRSA